MGSLPRSYICKCLCLCMSAASAPENPFFRPLLILPRIFAPCAPSSHLHLSKCRKLMLAMYVHACMPYTRGGPTDTRLGDCAPPAAAKLEAVEDEREGAKVCGYARRAGEPGALPCAPATCSTQTHTVNIRRGERARRQVGGGRWAPRTRLRARVSVLVRP